MMALIVTDHHRLGRFEFVHDLHAVSATVSSAATFDFRLYELHFYTPRKSRLYLLIGLYLMGAMVQRTLPRHSSTKG